MPEVQVVSSEVAQIVASVFDNMLRLEVSQCAEPWRPGPARMIAEVHLSGAWNGSVALECDLPQAREFTRRYLSSSAVSDEVTADLLGELANMIGGNWKCVLGRGLHLSAPEVAAGDFAEWSAGAGRVVEQLSFFSPEGVFWVTILAARR